MKEVTSKLIAKRMIAAFSLSFFVAVVPPFSLSFLFIASVVSVISTVAGIYGNRWRNKELMLVYHLTTYMLLFLLTGLRFWDVSIGLSWYLLLGLLPSIILAAILPYVNLNLSEFLFHEQYAPRTKIGRYIVTLALGSVSASGALGMSLGRQFVKGENNFVFVVLGFVMYLAFVALVLNSFYMYATNRFTWWQEKNTSASRKRGT